MVTGSLLSLAGFFCMAFVAVFGLQVTLGFLFGIPTSPFSLGEVLAFLIDVIIEFFVNGFFHL
jgi:hypothetical protein